VVVRSASPPWKIEGKRSLILEIFVYISLLFTLLTIPFLHMLKRELDRRGIAIRLASRAE
jgi:hypothetical protein